MWCLLGKELGSWPSCVGADKDQGQCGPGPLRAARDPLAPAVIHNFSLTLHFLCEPEDEGKYIISIFLSNSSPQTLITVISSSVCFNIFTSDSLSVSLPDIESLDCGIGSLVRVVSSGLIIPSLGSGF